MALTLPTITIPFDRPILQERKMEQLLDSLFDNVTAGTATSGKAMITDVNNNIVVGGGVQINGTTGGNLGYATGAGGTISQGGARTSAVTLNKAAGQIQLFAAAGSTAAATSFTLSNSVIAAADVLKLSVNSAANLYRADVTSMGAGTAQITFESISGTSSDAPTFNFVVIKGATS